MPHRTRPNAVPAWVWAPAFWAYALVATVLVAAWFAARAVPAVTWPRAVIWQAGVYGAFAPPGLAVWAVLRQPWSGWKTALALVVLTWISVPALALLSGWLDVSFTGHGRLVEAAERRAPIEILLFTALSAALFAQATRARAAEATRRASVLEETLASLSTFDREPGLWVMVGARRAAAPLASVERVLSAGNYAAVHWQGREGLVRVTLQSLVETLDHRGFARAHRSALVNLSFVRDVRTDPDGRPELIMASGAVVPVGRRHREALMARLSQMEHRPPDAA